MEAVQIQLIKDTWTDLLNKAKQHYDTVLTTDDLTNLTVKELQELITFSKQFIITMDKLFNDYRHLIGMADLKVTDKSKLTSLLGEIELYRTDAKRIASISDFNLIDLIPASSTYKLATVPTIQLRSKLRPGQVLPSSSPVTDAPLSGESLITSASDSVLDALHHVNVVKHNESCIRMMCAETDLQYAKYLLDVASKTVAEVELGHGVFYFKEKADNGVTHGYNVTIQDGVYTFNICDSKAKHYIFSYFHELATRQSAMQEEK